MLLHLFVPVAYSCIRGAQCQWIRHTLVHVFSVCFNALKVLSEHWTCVKLPRPRNSMKRIYFRPMAFSQVIDLPLSIMHKIIGKTAYLIRNNSPASGDYAPICSHQTQTFWLKCTKFNFSWGSAPDPAGGAYSAPPDSSWWGWLLWWRYWRICPKKWRLIFLAHE